MIILLVVQTTLRSVLNSEQGSMSRLTIYTCHCSRRMIAINNSWSLLVYKCSWNQPENISKNQKSCSTDLFKLFVSCSSWRILKQRLNHIFHYHLLRIFESFQGTSKIPTFTLSVKTNAQLHLKMLSCNFYFLKNLTHFRHIIHQLSRKFNLKFL